VLWAHDFRHDAEFHNFHRARNVMYQGGNGATNPPPNPYHATLVPTPFGASRAIRSAVRGTRLTRDVPVTRVGEIQILHVEDITQIEDPWDGPYRLIVAGREYVEVQSRDVASSTVRVRRTATRAYPAQKTTIGAGPQGRWIRPTAAFPAGQNGKPTDDPGVTNGAARKVRSWDPTDRAAHYKFREGYFGHKSYWDPAHGDARYKDWTPNTDKYNSTRADAWEGDEFYLQFRAKVSASRVKSGGGKFLYIQNCTSSGNGQFFIPVGGKTKYSDVPPNWPHGEHGNLLRALTCWGSDAHAMFGTELTIPQGVGNNTRSVTWLDGRKETGWQQHPDDFPGASYRSARDKTIGWHFPAEKWVTYLLHFKLGRESAESRYSTLAAPAKARAYGDKSKEVIHLADVSPFPDVSGPGGYEYFVFASKRGTKRRFTEHMRVLAVDRKANTLTVARNAARDTPTFADIKEAVEGWDTGTAIAYGCYKGEPYADDVIWGRDVHLDPRLGRRETTFEMFVAVEGETEYQKVMSHDKYAWMYGDGKGNYLNYASNPPGLNSIELSQYVNDYIGSGSMPPPPREHDIQYTQAILSREFIPPPRA
jgi:hypothetical protein